MADGNWTRSLTEDERQIVIGCLCHTLHEFDAPCLEGRTKLAEDLLTELDAHVNDPDLGPSPFVEKLPEEIRHALWASMWATIHDIHAPQDNMPEGEWRALEELSRLIDDAERGEAPCP